MLADKEVDDTMAADWAAIQDKYTPEPVDDAPDATPEAAPSGEETIPVSREADGKFKAQEKDKPKVDAKAKPAKDTKATPAAADPSAAAPLQEGAEAATAEPQQRDINRAPSTWKPAARAEFDKLSPSIKAEIHRREADFLNGQAQLRPDAELGRELRGVIDPYRMMIDAEGGTPARAVADLLRTAAVFRTGSVQAKYQAIAQIANQFGIDLKPLGQAARDQAAQQPSQPQQFRDPRVDQLLAQQNADRQASAQREQQQTESSVTRWMNEVDAQGNPKREYLGDVINPMSALVSQIRQNDPALTHGQALDQAYEQAIWAHPDIRPLLLAKQQTELDAQRRADNQTKVRDAKRAGSVNVPRRASSPNPGKPGTMEDTIGSTARALGLIT